MSINSKIQSEILAKHDSQVVFILECQHGCVLDVCEYIALSKEIQRENHKLITVCAERHFTESTPILDIKKTRQKWNTWILL